MKARPWAAALVLAFGLAGPLATITRAAQPGAVAQARKLIREAEALETKADQQRDQARNAHMAAVREANQLDDQAEAKRSEAHQMLQRAGFYTGKEGQANMYRLRARTLFFKANQLAHQAETLDARGKEELKRAKAQHQAAARLLATNPDAAMKADAADLEKQAKQDEQDAVELEVAEKNARKQAEQLRQAGRELIAKANQLDPDGK